MNEKKEKMYNGITNIDDKMIEEAQDEAVKTKKSVKWIPWAGVAAAACLGIGAGVLAINGAFGNIPVSGNAASTTAGDSQTPGISDGNVPAGSAENIIAQLIAKADYPEMPVYPEDPDPGENWDDYDKKYNEWSNAKNELRKQPEGYTDGTDKFFTESIKVLLSGCGTENRVYSPLSLFMALGMSAEITDGNTRQQILDLLGQDSIESLRSHSSSIWQANYTDDGMAKCVLANSIWLNKNISYSRDLMNKLCINYYASSYSGEPGTEDYDKLLQGWLNEQTSGMLENYVEGIKLDPQMVITLASTVDYAGKWNDNFSKEETKSGTFHSPTGNITCDFMNKVTDTQYFWSDKFASVTLSLENNGAMRLILPDEGITPEELLSDEKTMEFLMSSGNKVNNSFDNSFVSVTMSVPKFDVSSDINLIEELKKLGITDITDSSKADFSPLTGSKDYGTALSNATQAARVMIDEDGCRASALTIMMYCGAAMPQDKAEFILDRPFIFEIMSETGLPLFVGIVNNPV